MSPHAQTAIWIGLFCFLCFVLPWSVAYFIIDKDNFIRRRRKRKKEDIRQPRIIDYSFDNRGWGHNFMLSSKLTEDGSSWEIAGYCKGIRAGDILVMGLKADGSENKVYTVKEISYFPHPPDMYKAIIEHLPICKMPEGTHAEINKLL